MENPFHAILFVLALSVIVIAAFRRIHLPPILGYLMVGFIIGPSLFNVFEYNEHIAQLAEFGVVFLLFTVGLEFSLPQLFAMKTTVVGLGGLQVIVSAVVGAALSLLLGADYTTAIIVGGIVAMSSTAIVIKQLTEQLEINSRHGRNAIGILIFQDLAVIPFLIVLPLLHDATNQNILIPLSFAFIKGALAFIIMLALGRWALRPLFRHIAAARSNELFMLAVLLIALTAAWATSLADLSLAFGAFLAGAMLGETEFRHQIEAYMRPFRDILLGFFFISVGMLLNINVLISTWSLVIFIVIGLVFLKGIIIIILGRLFRLESGVAIRTGLVLSQGGEFGFAIISLAIKDNLLQDQTGQALLAGIVISMVIAPFLIRFNGAIAKFICRSSYLTKRNQIKTTIEETSKSLSNHVVICGYGRVGQNVARFLDLENINYIALDVDPYVIQEAHTAGENVFFGDATHKELLEAADLQHARILVIAYDDVNATFKVMSHAREIKQDIPILVRTRDDLHLESLMQKGATEVVPEKLEASLALISHLLLQLDVKPEEIEQRMKEVRANQYLILRSVFHGFYIGATDEDNDIRKQLHSVSLPHDAHAIGKTLQQLNLSKDKIVVTAIKRGTEKATETNPDMVLYEDDVLVLFGTYEDIEHAEAILLNG